MNRDELCKARKSYRCQLWEVRSWDGGDSGNPLPGPGVREPRAGVWEGKGNWITPKYQGSAHSRHRAQSPDLVRDVPDAKMLLVSQRAAGEAGGGRGSAHTAVTGESRVSVGTAPKSPGTAPGRIN